MTDEQWKKLKALYTEARKVDSGARAAFLTSVCGGDEELRRQAELLLEYGDKAEAESFLEGRAAEKNSAFWSQQLAELPGPAADHILDLSFSPGVEAYAFTFG